MIGESNRFFCVWQREVVQAERLERLKRLKGRKGLRGAEKAEKNQAKAEILIRVQDFEPHM